MMNKFLIFEARPWLSENIHRPLRKRQCCCDCIGQTMNRILLSWPAEKIIHEMQQLLIDHGILALTQPTQFDSHVTHYMLLTDDTDYAIE